MTDLGISPDKEASFSSFYYRQFFVTPSALSPDDVDLRGRTAIVTGSNSGLGLECSRQLLDLGLSKLIITVRNEAKGDTAKADLSRGRNLAAGTIQVWKLDLNSYESITAFVERAKRSLEHLDIVVLNAGISSERFTLNPDTGHEEILQVNYLSNALLAILLLPVLKSRRSTPSPGHLVLVSSDTACWANFENERNARPFLSALDNRKFDRGNQYYTAKLLGQLFVAELARHVSANVAIVTAATPGLCYGTELTRGGPAVIAPIYRLFVRIVGRPAAVGARVITYAAVKPGQEGHGHYIGDNRLKPMAPIVYTSQGKDIAEVVWQETMAELNFAHVKDIIKELGN
ncbi:hypothetical protein SLS62_001415 [Diatrype stigma]|uniref:Retinol dehydrogenase 12 n=1 Tax=Diatrype stigma TaxID=117547 RepID=A0AAN9VAJ6_9PEZI